MSTATLIDSWAIPAVAPMSRNKQTKNGRIEIWPYFNSKTKRNSTSRERIELASTAFEVNGQGGGVIEQSEHHSRSMGEMTHEAAAAVRVVPSIVEAFALRMRVPRCTLAGPSPSVRGEDRRQPRFHRHGPARPADG